MVDKKYLQTWKYVSRIRKTPLKFLYPGIQKLCEKITGHEASKTEHGYNGGIHCDHWCRWCNYMFQIPRKECPSGDWMEDMFDLEVEE